MDRPILVTGGILIKRGMVFIARRPGGSHLAGMWELPGGKIESGESPPNCLRRELFEELNVTVQVQDLEYFDESFYEYGYKRVHLICFIVKEYAGQLHPNEHEDARWVAINSLETFQMAPADVPVVKRLLRYFTS